MKATPGGHRSRNRRQIASISQALALGLIICPLLVYADIGLDLMWTGIVGGTVAYGLHRLRGRGARR